MTDTKTCPVAGVTEIDFNSREFAENYKQIYADIHASGCPYVHSTAGDFYGLASHADITKACTNVKMWSSKLGPALRYQSPDEPGVLVSVDPPEHTFEAKLVGKAFSKTYFESFIPGITEFINGRLDSVFADGKCDIHKVVSEPLPLWVIFAMFGRSIDDRGIELYREGFAKGIGAMLKPESDLGEGESTKGGAASEYIATFLWDHLQDVKAKVASGEMAADANLLTRFITAEVDGQRLTDEKIMAFCGFLLAAGSGTTTILVSALLYRLLREPEQLARVKADRTLVPLAIEECLRVDSPLHGLFRSNNEPIELGPLKLEKDTKVLMMWGAGNYDPNVFPDPYTFNLDRGMSEVRKHLSFGFGIHICRGAPLSRIEAELFINIILDRLPNVRLDGEVTPDYRIPIFSGIRGLPIAWDVA